ncbi:hypothetical protein [Vibrio sp. CK2-1]|uniref:hypothetical protein n=1 Tax=Vibrio sp. CK2-1 TaxID=2912249 RepID=UPI001F1E84A0|nr:hypothetical protein [Vibrio sp. CK2-1]MCF7354901.1 hypothetical protein [Vibrio sp. CK2-1]
MTLQYALKLKLMHSDLPEIAQLMGYNRKGMSKAASRIEQVLSDPQLNLYANAFDFKYSNQEFIERLCEVVGIDLNHFSDVIDSIIAHHEAIRDAFKSYVFVDTGFKRKSEPIFMLAFLEHHRYLSFPKEKRVLPVADQVAYVQACIKKHYAENDGALPMWGKIQRYVFFYSEGCSISLNGDGVILEANPNLRRSMATLELR